MIKLLIRELTKPDIPSLVAKFKEHNWEKPSAIFETYLSEQTAGERIILLAIYDGEIAGYITVKWLEFL